jgi:hypothetical protein
MKPTPKAKEINDFLNSLSGANREETISSNKCIPPPIGCGRIITPDTEFRNETSRKEYQISGLCQQCQDKVFGI